MSKPQVDTPSVSSSQTKCTAPALSTAIADPQDADAVDAAIAEGLGKGAWYRDQEAN